MDSTLQALMYLVGAGGIGAIIKTVFDYLRDSKQTAAKVELDKLQRQSDSDTELIKNYQIEIRRLSADRNRLLDMVIDATTKTEIATVVAKEVVDTAVKGQAGS